MLEMKEEKCLQNVILDMVNRFGYLGVLILIAVENVFPPIPSEVILTFGGFLTTCTRLHPAGVVLASTAGSLLGALVLYGAGTLVSPESLSRTARQPSDETSRFSRGGCLENDYLVSEKRPAGRSVRAVHSHHPKPHFRPRRDGADGNAEISAVYDHRKHGVEHSSRRNRCCSRRGVGAGGGVCEDVCRYRFSRAGSRSRMLSGRTFI